MYGPGVRRHIRKALELGATKEEITAVLQLVSVLGIHTMSLGAPILLEELDAATERHAATAGNQPEPPKETTMQFLDDSLLPENQQKLVIQVAPYGPAMGARRLRRHPGDDGRAGAEGGRLLERRRHRAARALREDDGKGSKRLSMFNELLARLREAVPRDDAAGRRLDLLRPREAKAQAAKWLSDDTRHMLAELDPKPDQVTVAINTNQMNVMELMTADDVAGTSLANPALQAAYRDMIVPVRTRRGTRSTSAAWSASGIQPHFMLGNLTSSKPSSA